MSRRATGTIREKDTARGRVYGLRFTAYGKRRYVTLPDGSSRADAERELRGVLADVERGVWRPPAARSVVELVEDPSFWDFAEAWFDEHKGEWRPNTQLDYQWQLEHHLLPFWKDHLVSQVTIAEVDRYRQFKVDEGVLSPASINKTITRLGQIMEVAVERELVARNPVKIGRRKLRVTPKPAIYLDSAEQVAALLQAAAELDAEAKSNGRVHRRAQLASLVFAGLRIDEHISLDWADVDLAVGRVRVRDSKTAAGCRYVTLRPALRDELAALKAELDPSDDAPVFATQRGGRTNPDNFRSRVLAKAVARANRNLAAQKRVPLPEGLTPHKLRHTFASILYALGEDPGTVMDEMGHTDPALALRLYRHAMRRGEDEKAKLRALVNGEELAPIGTSGESEGSRHESSTEVEAAKDPRLQAV
jgi:integrase